MYHRQELRATRTCSLCVDMIKDQFTQVEKKEKKFCSIKLKKKNYD